MKVLIACGGTGGHLFPGLAVAETMRQRQHQVKLLVSQKAIDSTALAALTSGSAASAITVHAVAAVGYSGWRRSMRFCDRFVRALGECVDVCNEFQPDVLLAMGGFTSAPAVLAARWRRNGTTTLIHESNAVPGKANRCAGKFANHIAVGLAECARFFGRKPVTVTGTPIRAALRVGRVADAHERLGLRRERLTILAMGGSQGAQAINELMAGALPRLDEWRDSTQFVHLSGERDEAFVREAYEKNGFAANVMSFCNQMELAYSAADLVVARSGAATLTELAAFGLPAVLIPFPHAAGDHQLHNARVFERAGAANVIGRPQRARPDGVAVGEQLAGSISSLLRDDTRRSRMASAARSLRITDAEERIATLLETYAH
ncbi:MAG TPA: undecaprenyldiphospho-muramoylpentapeptide beta-N-acetylglucosaminyltransferase [Verrucomicrobiae bacterium]|nr:undecaprenyldiphospho-muramoylpentapeptide beta-N-acetylglucosaminyltransferase [Verrucomicrobiae bacterium]